MQKPLFCCRPATHKFKSFCDWNTLNSDNSYFSKLYPRLDGEHQISFASYQLFVFVTSYLGYGIMLYNRKAFTFTLPHVIMEEYFSSYEVGELCVHYYHWWSVALIRFDPVCLHSGLLGLGVACYIELGYTL